MKETSLRKLQQLLAGVVSGQISDDEVRARLEDVEGEDVDGEEVLTIDMQEIALLLGCVCPPDESCGEEKYDAAGLTELGHDTVGQVLGFAVRHELVIPELQDPAFTIDLGRALYALDSLVQRMFTGVDAGDETIESVAVAADGSLTTRWTDGSDQNLGGVVAVEFTRYLQREDVSVITRWVVNAVRACPQVLGRVTVESPGSDAIRFSAHASPPYCSPAVCLDA